MCIFGIFAFDHIKIHALQFFSDRAARAVVEDGRRAVDAGAAGHVFNLGHGVLPETDPGVLTELVALVQSL